MTDTEKIVCSTQLYPYISQTDSISLFHSFLLREVRNLLSSFGQRTSLECMQSRAELMFQLRVSQGRFHGRWRRTFPY